MLNEKGTSGSIFTGSLWVLYMHVTVRSHVALRVLQSSQKEIMFVKVEKKHGPVQPIFFRGPEKSIETKDRALNASQYTLLCVLCE